MSGGTAHIDRSIVPNRQPKIRRATGRALSRRAAGAGAVAGRGLYGGSLEVVPVGLESFVSLPGGEAARLEGTRSGEGKSPPPVRGGPCRRALG